ncbi:uncharacterized protein DS421_3g105350 [Arachis hypogaea]|nr:uncharacterized protein DS421_3g105350 [Arachis hypogaea]
MLCIGPTIELLGAPARNEMEKVPKLEKSLMEREGVIVDLTKKMKKLGEEVGNLQEQIRTLQGQLKEADIEKGKMTSRIRELKGEGLEMFAASLSMLLVKYRSLRPTLRSVNLM